jgi:hypothetical protein
MGKKTDSNKTVSKKTDFVHSDLEDQMQAD